MNKIKTKISQLEKSKLNFTNTKQMVDYYNKNGDMKQAYINEVKFRTSKPKPKSVKAYKNIQNFNSNKEPFLLYVGKNGKLYNYDIKKTNKTLQQIIQ